MDRWHAQCHLTMRPVRRAGGLVVLLKLVQEPWLTVRPAVHQGPLPVLDDGDHVFAAQRLVRLQRVGEGQDVAAVAADDLLDPPQQFGQVVFDPVRERPARFGLGVVTLLVPAARASAGRANLQALRGGVRRHG